MANGVVWPSATGGGLTAGTGAFLQAIITKRTLDQEQERIGLEGRRVATEEDRVRLLRQAQALEGLTTMIPFLPRDVPIGEMPGIVELAGAAIPELDLNDPVLRQLVLNERTIDSVVNKSVVGQLDSLRGTPEGNALAERLANRVLLGTGTSTKTIEQGEEQQQVASQLFINAFESLKGNPKLMDQVFRTQLGIQQPVTFTDPVTGRDWTFDTAQGAALTAELMKHYSMLEFEFQKIGTQDKLDIAKELMDQVATVTGNDEALGRPGALQIIGAWEAQTQGEQRGELEPGTGPWYDLMETWQAQGKTGGLLAMQIFSASAFYGERSIDSIINSSPVGLQTAIFSNLAKRFADVLGTDDNDLILNLTKDALLGMQEFGMDLQNPRALGRPTIRFFNSPEVRFPGTSPAPGGGTILGAPGADATMVAPGGGAPLSPAIPTRNPQEMFSEAANRLWNAIDQYQNNKLSLEELREKYPEDWNFIVRMSRKEGR